MLSYLIRRLGYAVLTFFGITVAVFILIHSVPGDPTVLFLSGPRTVPRAIIERIRHEHHLDQPLLAQYGWWLRSVLTLDFGRSILDGQLVTERIARRMPNTALLNVIAYVIAAIIGVPIGLWSATRSGRLSERASAMTFFLLYSLPSFWVALLLMQFFSVKLNLLPLFGMTSDNYLDMSAGEQLLDRARHLVLPVITLSFTHLAILARYSKSALTEVIRQDFITTARAKGVTPSVVLWHHAFRNALIPLITLLGLQIPYLLSGSVIVEEIFEWDGIGRLYYSSIMTRDYPVVLGLTVATAIITLLASLLSDSLYVLADPRIRIAETKR